MSQGETQPELRNLVDDLFGDSSDDDDDDASAVKVPAPSGKAPIPEDDELFSSSDEDDNVQESSLKRMRNGAPTNKVLLYCSCGSIIF